MHTLFPHLDYQVKDILGHYLTIFFGSHHQNLSALRGEGSVGVATIARYYLSCNSGDRLKASSDSNSGRSLRSYGHSAGSYLNGGRGLYLNGVFILGSYLNGGVVSEWSFTCILGSYLNGGGGGGGRLYCGCRHCCLLE